MTARLFTGAMVAYLIFVARVFLSDNNVMVFDEYVPKMTPVGNDLRITVEHAAMLFTNRIPYYPEVPIPYPPLGLLLLRPLASIPFYYAYRVVVLATIASFLFLTTIAAGRLTRRRALSPEFLFIAAIGLVSYPFQFELERGQWNVIATALAIGAVCLFQSGSPSMPRRGLAFALLAAAVHLKLYPAIFAIGFWRRDWEWRRNVAHLAAVGAIAAGALLVIGPGMARSFAAILVPYATGPFYVWLGNHSISAFASLADVSSWPGTVLLAAMLLAALRRVWRDGDGADPFVLAALTLATFLLPSTSHDYKLSVLPFAMALLFAAPGAGTRGVAAVLSLVASVAYHIILVPYTAKTHLGPWSMSAHPLLLVLASVVFVWLVTLPRRAASTVAAEALS